MTNQSEPGGALRLIEPETRGEVWLFLVLTIAGPWYALARLVAALA